MTDVFALAARESEERTQIAQDNLLDPAALPPPAWKGLLQQPKRLLAQSARAGRTIALAGAPFAQAIDQAGDAFDDASDILGTLRNPGWRPSESTERTAAQDWYFRNVVDDLGSDAVRYWTPDAASTGSAANTVGTVFDVIGSIPQIVGTPGLFLSDSALSPATEVLQQGGDAETAAKVGGINFAANAVGFALPPALGKTLTTRIASGAGLNLATGVPADAASQAVLENAGLDELAASYDPFNAQARGLDILMGAAFGWRAHLDAPPVTPSQRAAILTANNAHHADFEAMPGEPRDGTAAAQHRNAMQTALQQVLRDQRVNVALDAAGFTLRPELDAHAKAEAAARPPLEGLVGGSRPEDVQADYRTIAAAHGATITSMERPVIARGAGARSQHPHGTAADFRTRDKTNAEVEALMADLRKAGFEVIDERNTDQPHIHAELPPGGRGYSEAELDAPNFGLPEAPRPLPDDSPLLAETAQIDTAERMALRESLVEETFAGIEPPKLEEGQRPVAYVMGGGGASGKGTILKKLIADGEIPSKGVVHIDPDEIKGRIPEYRQLRNAGDSRAAAVVHEESSQVARDVLQRAIAGKYDLVLDRTLGNKARGLKELQALKDAGYEVRLLGVTVDPRTAVSRAVKRAEGSGRFVPLDQLLTAHKGFADAFEDYAKLADSVRLFDNSGAEPVKLASKATGGELDITESEGYNKFRQRSQINEQAQTLRGIQAPSGRAGMGADGQAGRVGDRQAERAGRAGRGEGVPGRGGAQRAQDPEALTRESDQAIVDEISAQLPDLLVPDETGTLRPVAEFLAAVREAQAIDDLTLRGLEAAVNCAIGIEA